MSLKKILKSMVQSEGQVSSWSVEKVCVENNYKISNGERTLRLLAQEGLIESIKNSKGVVVGYRVKQQVFGRSRPVTKLYNLKFK